MTVTFSSILSGGNSPRKSFTAVHPGTFFQQWHTTKHLHKREGLRSKVIPSKSRIKQLNKELLIASQIRSRLRVHKYLLPLSRK